MKPILSENKQKILSVAIVSAISFLGLQSLTFSLGIYQQREFFLIASCIYLFLVFWLTFLFDLHLKKRGVLGYLRPNHTGWVLFKHALRERLAHVFNWHYFRHYLNFLILPSLLYWSAVILIFLNPFDEKFKQLIAIGTSIGLIVAYTYFKQVFSKQMESHALGIKILALIKLLAAFLSYSAIFGLTRYYGLAPVNFLAGWVFLVTFALVYQAVFQHHLWSIKVLLYIFEVSGFMALASLWAYYYWNYEYLTAGLAMLAVYNTFWGILHHYLDKNLTKKLVFEYLLLMIVVLSILFASHDFNSKIL